MIEKPNITNILFLDIETVPQYQYYDLVPENIKPLWDKKSQFYRKNEETPEEFYNKAGIWAEFGKIVCISLGKFTPTGQLKIKSLYGENEIDILLKFSSLLQKFPSDLSLCAHNGKEFDFPYLCRRALINELPIPAQLNTIRKKPWEVNHLDTLELWKFGDHKSYTSLELLAAIFDIPTPKDELDGSQVAHTYYIEKDLSKIVSYCQKDVLTLARVFQRLNGQEFVNDADVLYT